MDKKPDALDVDVGSRIRLRREELSIAPGVLAERLCISPRQLEKYECGIEKIGADRLLRISEVLGIPVTFFFRSTSDNALPSTERLANFRFTKHHESALQTALSALDDKRLRARVLAFVQSTDRTRQRALI
ncbi:helix-turn-helix transcriptional regulator [Rhizobium tropici]|uniref:Helix-turn-helix transcriptional regulator n=2 Tax=Rhizobium tropici TaxID=398 RepID=A0A5B0W1M4_RHITR|nr:helix-turn-helix transcriptional regulator [Rhizobium tropici]